MNGLLSALIREALNQLVHGQLARQSLRYGIDVVAFFAVVGVLALAALVFVYVALFLALSKSMAPEWAAAALSAATLLMIGLILLGRALVRANRPVPRRQAGRPEAGTEIDVAIALGRKLEDNIRNAAPQMTVMAAVAGLVVGLYPQIIELLIAGGNKKKPNDRGR